MSERSNGGGGAAEASDARDEVPAVGGTQRVPSPDPIARDYIELALRLDQHVPGLVDGYFGPRDLKANVEVGQLPPPAQLADDAARLRDRVADEIAEPDRRGWLDRQLIAMQTHAVLLAGEQLDYAERVRRCLDAEPEMLPPERYAAAHAELDAWLPGAGDLRERLATWEERFVVPVERLRGAIDWLLPRLREAAAGCFSIPSGESLEVRLVDRQPWSGYNWYDGGLHSRVDLNIDLPIRAAGLLATLAHETYPGHHLEHASKEDTLLRRQRRVEASLLLVAAPEAYVSEGLAELGTRFTLAGHLRRELLAGVFRQAGITAGAEEAERQIGIGAALRLIEGANADAALLLHAQGRPRQEILDYLEERALRTPERAAKTLEFIEHPLWSIHVFSYGGGRNLLDAWCSAAGSEDSARRRFTRLLTEQLTPSGINAELVGEGRAAHAPARAGTGRPERR